MRHAPLATRFKLVATPCPARKHALERVRARSETTSREHAMGRSMRTVWSGSTRSRSRRDMAGPQLLCRSGIAADPPLSSGRGQRLGSPLQPCTRSAKASGCHAPRRTLVLATAQPERPVPQPGGGEVTCPRSTHATRSRLPPLRHSLAHVSRSAMRGSLWRTHHVGQMGVVQRTQFATCAQGRVAKARTRGLRAREERLEGRNRDPDLKPDTPVPERARLDERVDRGSAHVQPNCHFRGADPAFCAPSKPRHRRAKRRDSRCDRCLCV